MVVIRATKKVLRYLPNSEDSFAQPSDNALGDWYVNRIVVDRQPLLLLLSAGSLLTILAPARNLRALPKFLSELVGARLRRLGITRSVVDAELASMTPVVVAPTVDRAAIGYLIQFAKEIPCILPVRGWDLTTLPFVEARLAETPCHLGKKWIRPERTAAELLLARWGSGP